jgi:hypothetical protein
MVNEHLANLHNLLSEARKIIKGGIFNFYGKFSSVA